MQGSIQLIGRYQNSLPTLDTMAPVAIPCEAQGCVYTTAEFEPGIAIQMLAYHRQDVHPQVQQPPQVGGQAASAKPRAEEVPRPQIKLGIGQDDFSYFKNRWTSYKRSCGITDETETRDQLCAACHEDLKRNLFGCLGSKLETSLNS